MRRKEKHEGENLEERRKQRNAKNAQTTIARKEKKWAGYPSFRKSYRIGISAGTLGGFDSEDR